MVLIHCLALLTAERLSEHPKHPWPQLWHFEYTFSYSGGLLGGGRREGAADSKEDVAIGEWYWLTSILGEEDILGLEIGMDDLVAVQEDQATDDVQSYQMTLTASTHHTLHHRKGGSREQGGREGASEVGPWGEWGLRSVGVGTKRGQQS